MTLDEWSRDFQSARLDFWRINITPDDQTTHCQWHKYEYEVPLSREK